MTVENVDVTSGKAGWSFPMVCVTGAAYLTISAMGFSMSALNSPSQLIMEFMNQTELDRTGQSFTASELEFLYGLMVALLGLGAAFGSSASDAISDFIGRKYALYLSCVTGCFGTLLMALCRTCKSYEMLFVGRVINGACYGLSLSISATYIMEMCLPHQKGVAAMACTVSQTLSFMLSQVCGYEELLGNSDHWHYLIGFPLILLGLQLLILPLCPHNPRYLLVKRNDEAGAIKALQLIRGRVDVTEDIEQIRKELAESQTDPQVSVFQLFLTPVLRRPLLVAVVMGLHQNWCGIGGILLFSGLLFHDVGITGRSTRYATSGTGAVFFLSNIAATFLLPHFRRKTIFVAGTAALSGFCVVFAVTTIFQEEVEFLKYINIVVALLMVACFCMGPVCVFFVLLGEMFPHSARGAAFAVGILCSSMSLFAHSFALPIMINAMSSYTFFVFAGIDAAMVLFSILFMPETKDKSFPDIAKTWMKPGEMDNSFKSPANSPFTITLNEMQPEYSK